MVALRTAVTVSIPAHSAVSALTLAELSSGLASPVDELARVVDLLIAATALAHELPLYTLNAADLVGLDPLIKVIDLG